MTPAAAAWGVVGADCEPACQTPSSRLSRLQTCELQFNPKVHRLQHDNKQKTEADLHLGHRVTVLSAQPPTNRAVALMQMSRVQRDADKDRNSQTLKAVDQFALPLVNTNTQGQRSRRGWRRRKRRVSYLENSEAFSLQLELSLQWHTLLIMMLRSLKMKKSSDDSQDMFV